MNKSTTRDLKTIAIGKKIWEKKQSSLWKGLFENKVEFEPSKVHNKNLIKVLRKRISNLSLLFHFSTHIYSL